MAATPFWKNHTRPLMRLFKTERPTSLLLIPTDKVLSLPWVPWLFMGKSSIKLQTHSWMPAGLIGASLSQPRPWFCWDTHSSRAGGTGFREEVKSAYCIKMKPKSRGLEYGASQHSWGTEHWDQGFPALLDLWIILRRRELSRTRMNMDYRLPSTFEQLLIICRIDNEAWNALTHHFCDLSSPGQHSRGHTYYLAPFMWRKDKIIFVVPFKSLYYRTELYAMSLTRYKNAYVDFLSYNL